jgi:hypothetical protein
MPCSLPWYRRGHATSSLLRHPWGVHLRVNRAAGWPSSSAAVIEDSVVGAALKAWAAAAAYPPFLEGVNRASPGAVPLPSVAAAASLGAAAAPSAQAVGEGHPSVDSSSYYLIIPTGWKGGCMAGGACGAPLGVPPRSALARMCCLSICRRGLAASEPCGAPRMTAAWGTTGLPIPPVDKGGTTAG